MPEISFLLSVFNGERYLAPTVRSLLDQDYADYDIVVVDDGSTDRSREIIDRFRTDRLRVLDRPNGGLVEALNFGLTCLNCKFVARIDADDICYPHRLKVQKEFIEFTSAAAVSARSLHIDEVGNILGLSNSFEIFNANAHALPALEPHLPHPFLFARRDILDEIGGYRHAHLAEEADISWRLSELYQIAVQDEIMGKNRLHTDCISAKSLRNGRVQALFSQIAAMNSVRRETGREEIEYVPSLGQALAAGHDWERLFAMQDGTLDADEKVHLRLAAYLKHLDLARLRSYVPQQDDIDRASAALTAYEGLSDDQRSAAEVLITEARDRIMPHVAETTGFVRSLLQRLR